MHHSSRQIRGPFIGWHEKQHKYMEAGYSKKKILLETKTKSYKASIDIVLGIMKKYVRNECKGACCLTLLPDYILSQDSGKYFISQIYKNRTTRHIEEQLNIQENLEIFFHHPRHERMREPDNDIYLSYYEKCMKIIGGKNK